MTPAYKPRQPEDRVTGPESTVPGFGHTGPDRLTAARLEGVQLAARTLAHRLNNHLAVAMGILDLLRDQPELPAAVMENLEIALSSIEAAALDIRRAEGVTRLVTVETPVGPALDLEKSIH